MPATLDKSEHYDRMHAALAQLAAGNIPADVQQFANRALSVEMRNENDQTLAEFMVELDQVLKADPWNLPAGEDLNSEDWVSYWASNCTPEEAAMEDFGQGDHDPADAP